MLNVLSCLTCAKSFEHAGDDAAGWAIFLMLCVLVVVLSILVFTFIRLGAKSKAALDPEFKDA